MGTIDMTEINLAAIEIGQAAREFGQLMANLDMNRPNLDTFEGACLAIQRQTHLMELEYWEEFLTRTYHGREIAPSGVYADFTEEQSQLRQRVRQRIDNIHDQLLNSAKV